jgi:RHS repeat-associated protein
MYSTNSNYFKTHDRYGCQGQEMDNEVKGEGNSYDFGARMLDSRLGRWLCIDAIAGTFSSHSPYNYVRNNPVLRVDANGEWDVEVHVASDRSKYGYGIAIVKDRKGNEVFRFKVRVEGSGGKDRMVKNSDTPTGIYDIPDNNMWLIGGDRGAYGKNHRLILNGESGEIKESGRGDIRIHGGRQEQFNSKTGEWEEVPNPVLKKTHGCFRSFDEEIKEMKVITDKLEANDSEEKGGKLTVVPDLVEVDGQWVIPQPAKMETQQMDAPTLPIPQPADATKVVLPNLPPAPPLESLPRLVKIPKKKL